MIETCAQYLIRLGPTGAVLLVAAGLLLLLWSETMRDEP